ncbi:MAG TPA: thiamine-phosphate kinase [Acidobacteriota bacterium]|nr:thiamine-phosphate kinase [Acidobacteriota bacterium]
MRSRGEFELIERIKSLNLSGGRYVKIGIGDDCAVLAPPAGNELTVTTDMLVEGIDFRRSWMPPAFLGWKSLAVSLSDLAAMGAQPIGCLLALALPPALTDRYFDEFIEGFLRASELWSAPLAGGDLSASEIVSVTVTAFGTVPAGQAIRRRGAVPGDLVVVVGDLGLSRLGLELLEMERLLLAEKLTQPEELDNWAQSDRKARALRAHLLPRPLLSVGAWVRENRLAHAMIDVSDGLLADLQHILEESQTAAELDVESLSRLRPRTDTIMDLDFVLNGGEDYALLLALTPEQFEIMTEQHPAEFPDFSAIGRIVEGPPSVYLTEEGQKKRYPMRGFEHFR